MNNRTLKILVIVAVLAAAYLYLSRGGASSSKAPSVAQTISTAVPIESVTRKIGDGTTRSISFKFVTDKICGPSDLDLINEDLARANAGELLVSLETPLSEVSSGETSKIISTQDLSNGFTSELTVADSGSPTYAQLFLCKDQSGSGKCSEKEIGGYQNLSRNYLQLKNDQAKLQEYASLDKIYFFYPIVISNDQIRLFDSIKIAMNGGENTFLAEFGSLLGTSPRVTEEGQKAVKLNQLTTLGNVSVDGQSLLIKLPVPSSDPSCQAPTPPSGAELPSEKSPE